MRIQIVGFLAYLHDLSFVFWRVSLPPDTYPEQRYLISRIGRDPLSLDQDHTSSAILVHHGITTESAKQSSTQEHTTRLILVKHDINQRAKIAKV